MDIGLAVGFELSLPAVRVHRRNAVSPEILSDDPRERMDQLHAVPFGALVVQMAGGRGPSTGPSIREVLRLRNASLTRWSLFLTQYGIPSTDARWRTKLETEGREGLREEYTFPLQVLWSLADNAALLEVSDASLRVRLDGLREYLQKPSPFSDAVQKVCLATGRWPSTDEELKEFAQENIRSALRDTLAEFAPRSSIAAGGKVRWRFYAQGWWPMTRLTFLVPTRNHLGSVNHPEQQCQECGGRIPLGRLRKQAHYCSKQCYWRRKQKKRRALLARKGHGTEDAGDEKQLT